MWETRVRTVELTCVFFFFQAEDGIRDLTVTGVQTCALPISCERAVRLRRAGRGGERDPRGAPRREPRDRKSTRLNSSHSQISYAVFCLKKKKKTQTTYTTYSTQMQSNANMHSYTDYSVHTRI